MIIKVMFLRAIYLEIEEKEPMLSKSFKDIQGEFATEYIVNFMECMEKELGIMKDIKSEEV